MRCHIQDTDARTLYKPKPSRLKSDVSRQQSLVTGSDGMGGFGFLEPYPCILKQISEPVWNYCIYTTY